MPVLVPTNTGQIDALTDLNAGILALAEVALFQDDVPVTATSVLGDFTEANYTGYAREAIATATPSISDDGVPELVYPVGEFRPTATTVGNPAIYGGLLLTAGGVMIAGWRMDDPPPAMQATTDIIVVTLRIRVDPIFGLTVIVS